MRKQSFIGRSVLVGCAAAFLSSLSAAPQAGAATTLLPDLVASVGTLHQETQWTNTYAPSAYTVYEIPIYIKNQGVRAAGPFGVLVRVWPKGADGQSLRTPILKTIAFEGLPAGGSTGPLWGYIPTVVVTSGEAPYGIHHYGVHADATGRVMEQSETNNFALWGKVDSEAAIRAPFSPSKKQ